jgi:hypothetical protein
MHLSRQSDLTTALSAITGAKTAVDEATNGINTQVHAALCALCT